MTSRDESEPLFGDESPFVAAFELSPCPTVVSAGPAQRLLSLNAAARTIFGEPLGRPVRSGIPGLPERAYDAWDRVARSGVGETVSPADSEDRPFMSGRRFHVLLSPWTDAEGTTGVVAHLDDLGHVGVEQADRRTLLQESFLPREIPLLAGADVAAAYALTEVGDGPRGDWYDVVPRSTDRLAVVVGDVVGRGPAATAVMASMRAVLNERLRSGAALVDALQALDRYSMTIPNARGVTVCVAEIDLVSGQVRYCTAGHPPPLVVGNDRDPEYLPRSGPGPLGTGETPLVAEVELRVGDLLLLYTDGAVQRPGRSTVQNVMELAAVLGGRDAAAASRPSGSPSRSHAEAVCEETLARLIRATGTDDDVALVAVRRVPAPAPLAMDLEAVPESVSRLRHALGEWLAPLHVREVDEFALQHAVGEAMANAVRHPGTVGAGAMISVEVSFTGQRVAAVIRDRGSWREPTGGDVEGGRGLGMARGLADELVIERAADGTTVRVGVDVARAAALFETVPPDIRRQPFPDELETLASGPQELRLAGALDVASSERLRHVLLRRSRGGWLPVTVDLSEVTVLDSAGVRVLHEAIGWRGDREPAVELVAEPGSAAQHVLEMAGLPYRRPGDDSPPGDTFSLYPE